MLEAKEESADLALQDHDCVVEVMVLQGGRCSVEQSESRAGPGE